VKPLRTLFLTRDASRTGAPRVLLTLARQLTDAGAIQPAFLIRQNGPLIDEFRRLGPTATLETPWPSTARFYRGPVYDTHVFALTARLALRTRGFDLIYANTITNGRRLETLRSLRLPVVTHVHELEYAVSVEVSPASLHAARLATTQYIACSDAVERFLVDRLDVPEERVRIVHEFIDTAGVVAAVDRGALRRSLGIDERTVVVGGCGTLDERKGSDLFVEVAAQLRRSRPDLFPAGAPPLVRFVWLGGARADVDRFRAVARAQDLADSVTFVGEVDGAARLFADFDMFLLTSREDPYPLVVLECAALGVPSIVFAGAGGAPEFVEGDAGVQVAHLDVEAMTNHVSALVSNPSARAALGRSAARKVAERHDVRAASATVLEIMRQCV